VKGVKLAHGSVRMISGRMGGCYSLLVLPDRISVAVVACRSVFPAFFFIFLKEKRSFCSSRVVGMWATRSVVQALR
jgi:hypothetical protein